MKHFVTINIDGKLVQLDAEEINVVGVEEDEFGRDVVEFEHEGEVYKSLVRRA